MDRRPSADGDTASVRRLLSNDYIALIARLIIGLFFVTASIDKIADPVAFAKSIMNYRIVSAAVALIIATILPWMELLCGLAILFGIFLRGSSLLVFIMLVVFTSGITSALIRGLDIICGCFTQDPSAEKVGWLNIGENSLLIIVSLFLFYSTSVRLSLERYLKTHMSPQHR
jgi:uncharacterized membrane protein YphA (DoxX/SURF4 family)